MDEFIEAMIKGHDNSLYNWVAGDYCMEFCLMCRYNDVIDETMRVWQAKGLPQTNGKAHYHECGDKCDCRLEKI